MYSTSPRLSGLPCSKANPITMSCHPISPARMMVRWITLGPKTIPDDLQKKRHLESRSLGIVFIVGAPSKGLLSLLLHNVFEF